MNQTIKKQSLSALTLGAIGVVYGDIGTSPLYTLKTVFDPSTGVAVTPQNVLGAVSAILWLLTMVVTLKYVILVLRADNRGEGGIMALLALASRAKQSSPGLRQALVVLGVLGAALFYADCFITPSISVLSAVEGLEVFAPSLSHWVVPISVAILVVLFMVQKHGTHKMGQWFGPIMVLWFAVLSVVGVVQIMRAPAILLAFDPRHALHFLFRSGSSVFILVGAVVLAVTGAEALYADMGHFGRKAIRMAWSVLVLPGLALNYLGQGALLLVDPRTAENPFYLSFPNAMLLPAIVLSTAATVIASQAVITGAYSMARQIIQLGLLPRMHIVHTSSGEAGQIYVPAVNWILLMAVLLATFLFRSSESLANAYGIAVTGTMVITTVLTYFVVRDWGLPAPLVAFSTLCFFALDAVLFVSCTAKFLHGGWFPILFAIVLLTLMLTWKRGRELLIMHIREGDPKLDDFLSSVSGDESIPRIERVAVFLVADPQTVPQALLHNLKHNMVLHRYNVITTVRYHDVPWIPEEERLDCRLLAPDFWQVYIHFGFMDTPDVPKALRGLTSLGIPIDDDMLVSFFLSRETVVPSPERGMARWREELFATLSRNAGSVVSYFNIPGNSVIELGTRVHI